SHGHRSIRAGEPDRGSRGRRRSVSRTPQAAFPRTLKRVGGRPTCHRIVRAKKIAMSAKRSCGSIMPVFGTLRCSRSFTDSARFAVHWPMNFEEKMMRKYILPIVAVAMLGGATSAMAYDSG